MLTPDARALCFDMSSVVALNLCAFLWLRAGKPRAGEAHIRVLRRIV